jgi:hypothetical protein
VVYSSRQVPASTGARAQRKRRTHRECVERNVRCVVRVCSQLLRAFRACLPGPGRRRRPPARAAPPGCARASWWTPRCRAQSCQEASTVPPSQTRTRRSRRAVVMKVMVLSRRRAWRQRAGGGGSVRRAAARVAAARRCVRGWRATTCERGRRCGGTARAPARARPRAAWRQQEQRSGAAGTRSSSLGGAKLMHTRRASERAWARGV